MPVLFVPQVEYLLGYDTTCSLKKYSASLVESCAMAEPLRSRLSVIYRIPITRGCTLS